MAHEVIRTVTQPFHGPDGTEVLYQPGDQVPVDADLPDGLRTTLGVAEAANEPEPAAEVQDKPKPAPKPAAGKSTSS
jgi:hypothetical protein